MAPADPIVTRLQNLYLRGFRRAVAGERPAVVDPLDKSPGEQAITAYTSGYSAGERALKLATSNARDFADRAISGERIKP